MAPECITFHITHISSASQCHLALEALTSPALRNSARQKVPGSGTSCPAEQAPPSAAQEGVLRPWHQPVNSCPSSRWRCQVMGKPAGGRGGAEPGSPTPAVAAGLDLHLQELSAGGLLPATPGLCPQSQSQAGRPLNCLPSSPISWPGPGHSQVGLTPAALSCPGDPP